MISCTLVFSGYVRYALTIHSIKYQIHNHTIIPLGQFWVIRIFIQYAQNINRYINASGKNMNDQKILLMRDGLIVNLDLLFISSTKVK